MNLYTEWQSEQMLRARITANVVLRQALAADPPMSFTGLSETLLESDKFEDWVAVSTIIHFFEQLSIALQENQLTDDLFWRLFGRYVAYWRQATLDALIDASRRVDPEEEAGWTDAIEKLQPAV